MCSVCHSTLLFFLIFFPLYWSFSVTLGKNRQSYLPEAAVQTPRPAHPILALQHPLFSFPWTFKDLEYIWSWDIPNVRCSYFADFLNLPENDIWCIGWLFFGVFFWLAILVVLNIWHSRWLDIFNSSLLHTGLKISSWTWLREQHALFYLV